MIDQAPINAGYMVLEPEVLDYIAGDDISFEKEPIRTDCCGGAINVIFAQWILAVYGY